MIIVRTEAEAMALETAMSSYGVQLEGVARADYRNRLSEKEREAFDAGWEASRQYHKNAESL